MLRLAFSTFLACCWALPAWMGVDAVLAAADAQFSERSGPLIAAEEPTSENGYVAMEPVPEIISTPVDAEFIFLSGYEASTRIDGFNRVQILLDRPGSEVVLILTSYEPVIWELEATPETLVRQVLVGGYHDSALRTDLVVTAYRVDIGHAHEVQNRKFREALDTLHGLYGIESIDYHYGQYRLPPIIAVRDLGRASPALSRAWPTVTTPPEEFRFDLSGSDFRRTAWAASGPVDGDTPNVFAPETVALSPDRSTAYRIAENGIEIVDLLRGTSRTVDIPFNFERISWPQGIAYDSNNDLVTIVSSGGGGAGAFYRFDAVEQRWKDYRQLSRMRNLDSLGFDPVNGVYVAADQDDPGLYILSPEGEYLEEIALDDVLLGICRNYDCDNRGVPSLSVMPHGRYVAIMMIAVWHDRATSRDPRRVRQIWLYDRDTHTAELTYVQE